MSDEQGIPQPNGEISLGAPGEIRVSFGPRPTQNVPLEWAALILRGLAKRNPALFGKLLVEASQVEETARQ